VPAEENPVPAPAEAAPAEAGSADAGSADAGSAARVLRFAYVAGVTPGKWIRRWEERMPGIPLQSFLTDEASQLAVLRDGSADLSFVRLPVEREGLSVIPLYEEQPVVVAPKGHEISVFEEVPLEDLAEETFLDVDGLGGPEIALQVVASGAGLVILPMSVARHFNVKDTVARRLTGAPGTEIALAWPSDATDEVIEEFIGIVRGRTAQSSRQPSAQQEKPKKVPKPDRRGTGGGAKKPQVAQRYAPNPDKGRGRGSRKKGRR
jgi:DNA-binding transcriptional LysR family regulator